MKILLKLILVSVAFTAPLIAQADTISPTSYAASLAVGESVTISKTVTIEESVTSGVLDVVFLIDTSGSMGPAISSAKSAAAGILSGLSGFGNLATGTGYYSEPGSGLLTDLTTDDVAGVAAINAINLGLGGFGGDFPEEGLHATRLAAENTSWRPGSSRFIIALGDATFKESDGTTLASTQAALAASGATFIGIDFANMTNTGFGGIDPTILALATGGSIVPSSTDVATLTADIIDSVGDVLAAYSEVTVDDMGAGMPGVDVSVACISADIGACIGDTATGPFDRSIARTFEFEVTFTGLAAGDYSFDTKALVDGGEVAAEDDRITVTGGSVDVSEPSSLLLSGLGLICLGLVRRRIAK